jgi:hypothetical protein
MRARHWMLVLIFILPLLVQGLLGARRGPTFLALAGIAGSYILVFRPRIPLLVVITGGMAVGLLLLWLVANRSAIYLGSDEKLDGSVSMMLQNWSGNEYLYSSAIVRYVQETGETFDGLRILAHMSARIVPHSLWPTKYADVVSALGLDIDLTRGAGIPVDRIATVTGWDIAVGAAPSIVGDFWLEFGMFAPVAIFAIGWLYGRLWALNGPRARRTICPMSRGDAGRMITPSFSRTFNASMTVSLSGLGSSPLQTMVLTPMVERIGRQRILQSCWTKT